MSGGGLRALNWRRALSGGQTQPQVFECDDGRDWVLKLPGNPHGDVAALCADWIGTNVAALAGVPTLECSLVHVEPDALWTLPKEIAPWAKPGTAFATVFLRQAGPVTGLTAIRQGTTSLDLMRIVAVDTWLDELDRKKPLRGEWNLLSDASAHPARVLAIDYGMCLTELLGPPILGQITMQARMPEEWRPWLQESDIPTAIAGITAILEQDIQRLVRAVPATWRSALPRLAEVPAYLIRRRDGVEHCLRKALQT